MNSIYEKHWIKWEIALKERGLDQFVASLLEVTKPINLIFAQLVYIGKPMFNGHFSTEPILAFANLLEDDHNINRFIDGLRDIK